MVKVLNTSGILTLSDFVHALRHGSIAEQIQDEADKCSFTGSLGCPQLESCAIDHDHRGIILRPVFRLRTDPICEDIVIQEDTVICHRTPEPEPAPTPINRPRKHHHHHVQKVTHHHHHKHNCSRRKAPVRSQSITNRGFQPASNHDDVDICHSVYYTPRSPKNTHHHCKHLSRSNRHRLEASKMEYAKRKIHFASPEVAQVQQIYSAEPSEIAIKEENHHELQQKESDIFTHQKLAVKKEGNTGSVRKVFSNGDAGSQNAASQSTVKERAETEELSPTHEEEPDLNEDVSVDENHHEIMEPSAKKTTYTQVTSREDEIIEKNFEKSVQVTDGLHQSRMFRFNDDDYSVSSRTLPKSTFRSEVYRPDDDGEESSLASDESCDCCCEIKVPPRVNSLQKTSPPPVPPHRMHLQGSEESGVRRNRRNYPKCSGGYKWERDFQSTDDSSMLSRLGARLIGSRTSNTNTSVSEGDYCVHEN